MSKEIFETKIAIVLEEGLQSWQKLNVSAFLGSSIASHFPETMGPDFQDASNVKYLGIFRHPVLIFSATSDEIKKAYSRARERNLMIGIYTRPIFTTQGEENLQAVRGLKEEEQDIVGFIVYGPKGLVNKSLNDLPLHK